MEYAAMLSAPDLVSGLRDLLADRDAAVVKRTVRVFANVYRHALGLLASGELDEPTFEAAWPAVRGVADELTALLASSENEGVSIHVVRFLEAALVAHLLSDVSRFPAVAAQGPPVVERGVAALRALITTPYVGGSAFIVAVRALITVACYKRDLWEPVTGLIEAKIASPPPTLFDHNVRTFHKMLQRNLFRLLRRTESMQLRSRLIDMMVTVGVPRRMLSQWAPPPPEARHKRPAAPSGSTPPPASPTNDDEDDDAARSPPPAKRPRTEPDAPDDAADDDSRAPSGGRDPRESRDPREKWAPKEGRREGRDPRHKRNHKDSRDPRAKRETRDPRETSRPSRDPRAALKAGSMRDPRDPRMAEARMTPPLEGQTPSPPRSPAVESDAGRPSGSPPAPASAAESAPLEFLKSLISGGGRQSPAAPSGADRGPSAKERAVYARLDHARVATLVLSCLEAVPDTPPRDLLQNLRGLSSDVEGMRRHLATLLSPLMPDSIVTAPSLPDGFPGRGGSPRPPSSREPSPPSPPSSDRSTPSDISLGGLSGSASDVDLRHLLNRGFSASASDVDMRDPRRAPHRDPRKPSPTGDPRTRSLRTPDEDADPVHVPRSSIMDPRITASAPPPFPGFGGRQDPRLMGGPAGGPPPLSRPLGMVGPPPGPPGPPMDPRANRGPGLFGPRPGGGGMRGPWHNGNMQPNPLALMMSSINTAMFPQAPPMHL